MNSVTLSITNLDQLQHDVTARHRFDCKGGTIGSERASWRINDRAQAVAPLHCEIRWLEGSFCVIDHCHRTYLNDSSTSLETLAPRRLVEGDQLRIGAYRLQVQYAQDQACTRSLEDLFNPDRRVLDRLIAEEPATPWPTKLLPLNQRSRSARSSRQPWALTLWQRWTQRLMPRHSENAHCSA